MTWVQLYVFYKSKQYTIPKQFRYIIKSLERLEKQIGNCEYVSEGLHKIVFRKDQTVYKIFKSNKLLLKEQEIYLKLTQCGIEKITVPTQYHKYWASMPFAMRLPSNFDISQCAYKDLIQDFNYKNLGIWNDRLVITDIGGVDLKNLNKISKRLKKHHPNLLE